MAKLSLLTNRKFRRLIRLLNMPEAHVLGHIELLWMSTYQQESGDVGDVIDIEEAAKWIGESGVFCKALAEVGFLDSTSHGFRIHDWEDHVPAYVRRRQKRKRSTTDQPVANQRSTTDEHVLIDGLPNQDKTRQDKTRKEKPRQDKKSESPTPAEFDHVTASPTEINRYCFDALVKVGIDQGAALKLVNGYAEATSTWGMDDFPRVLFQIWHYHWQKKHDPTPKGKGWLYRAIEEDYKPPDEFKVPR